MKKTPIASRKKKEPKQAAEPAAPLAVEEVPIAVLVHPPYNPRKAVKRGTPLFNQIKASLESFGMLQPVVVNRRTMHIVGGNQRVTVMSTLGRLTAPTVYVDLDDQKERELNLALNKIGEENWHSNKLATLLMQLKDTSDLESLGFSAASITALIKAGRPQPKGDPDAPAPPPAAKPWVKPGDVFTLHFGDNSPRHRVMCGDSTSVADMRKLAGDDSADLIFTDPPYGVAYKGSGKNLVQKEIQGDMVAGEPLKAMLTLMFRAAASVATATAPIYTFYASRTHREFEDALNAAGFTARQQIIWVKQMALGRSDYHWSHEPCLYAAQATGRGPWRGARIETTVWKDVEPELARLTKTELLAYIEKAMEQSTAWKVARDNASEYIHPTQKPIALAKRAIANHLSLRDTVLDFCGGSGSTLIAAAESERRSFTMEKEPGFAQALIKRFANLYEGAIVSHNGKTIAPDTL